MKMSKVAMMFAAGFVLSGQTLPNLKVDLPKDSPVALLTYDPNGSSATTRGGLYIVDVRAQLSLKNSSQQRIRGISFAIYAPEVGGKGSVSVPSLDVGPGETFSVRVENHLVRPLAGGSGGPNIEVKLDGVFFDIGFYGPDTLNLQRSMLRWELETRRDRKYFKSVLETAGTEGLRKEMLAILAQQNDRHGPGVQMVRGRATNIEAEREVQFAFVSMPDSPVEVVNGSVQISDSAARAPRFSVRNRSNRPVEHLEIGWIVRDQQGREFFAASLPADIKLAPNQTGEIREDAALRFQQPIAIQSLRGYIASVEFASGSPWVPARATLGSDRLRGLVPPSPEELRLLQIYNRKGLDALIEELKKF
jgi:hypothetical protein